MYAKIQNVLYSNFRWVFLKEETLTFIALYWLVPGTDSRLFKYSYSFQHNQIYLFTQIYWPWLYKDWLESYYMILNVLTWSMCQKRATSNYLNHPKKKRKAKINFELK
jgi:hypothetical protein